MKTKEPLMRVWNGKIRAENVLVGGIESAFVVVVVERGTCFM